MGENMKKLNKKAPKVITDLKNLVISGSEKFGDKVLYEYKDGVEVKKYTHNDLLSDMNALGTALDKRGFTGKTIAVIGDTSPFWTLTYLTTVNGNGIIVPLDKELSLTSICDFLKISDCSAIAYTGSFNGKLTSLSDSIPEIKLFIRLNKDKDGADIVSGDAEAIDLEDLINEGNDLLDSGYKAYTDIIPDMNKCCAILFTSGTTGVSIRPFSFRSLKPSS
jgi:long-chain acyl-CoA synthetase